MFAKTLDRAKDDFFSQPQVQVPIREFFGKSPMFYRKMQAMGAIFTGDLDVLRSWVESSGWYPIAVTETRGLVMIMAMDYEHSDVGPYRELALAVPVSRSLSHSFKEVLNGNIDAVIRELPVNTLPAVYGGIDYFGFPKYLTDIDFRETATHRVCTVLDSRTKQLIVEFEMRKPRVWSSDRVFSFRTYSEKEATPLKGLVELNPEHWGGSILPWDAKVRTGPCDRAAAFRELHLGKSLLNLYMPNGRGILHMPEVLQK